MTDPELPPEISSAIDRAVASVPPQPPPPEVYLAAGSMGPPHRPFRYAAAVAALLLVGAGIYLLQDDDADPTVDAQTQNRAAAPTSSVAPSPSGATDGTIAAQLEADALIAAEHGFTLGLEVIEVDGSVVLENQPDLLPIIGETEVEGYARREDLFDPELDRFDVFGPDGVTVRGVLDVALGFVPTEGG